MMSEASQGPGEAAQSPSSQTAARTRPPEPAPLTRQLGDFSADGLEAYEKALQDYIIALEQTSRAKARLKNSSAIDSYHVQLAVDFLNNGNKSWVAHVSDVGVLLIGAGLAYLGNIIFGSSHTTTDLVFTFVPLLLGGMAYAYAWGRRNE